MLTHWIVDSGEWNVRPSVSMATLTIVVSKIDMIVPSTTTMARARSSASMTRSRPSPLARPRDKLPKATLEPPYRS